MHASPYKVINDPDLVDRMEQTLKERRLQQCSMNIERKLIKPAPKFKKGNLVRYLMRKSKFSKESSLVRSWSEKIYSIHSINKAHSFKPMHTYILSELGMDTPSSNLPPIQENLLKKAFVTNRDTFAVEKILKQRGNRVLVKWSNYDLPTCMGTKLVNTKQQLNNIIMSSTEGSQRYISSSVGNQLTSFDFD